MTSMANLAQSKEAANKALTQLLLDTRPFAQEIRWKSWFHLVSTIFVLAICLFGTTLPISYWGKAVFSVVSGLVIVRLFIIYHDYKHGAIFRKRNWDSRLAGWILDFWGMLILNPPAVWNRSHNYHHQHNAQIATASIGSFPVMTVEQYKKASSKERLMYRLARNPFTILFGYVTIFIIGMCSKSFLTDPKRHFDSLVALVIHAIIFTLAVMAGWEILLFTLIIPYTLSCASGAYLFYIQHNFPDMKLLPREKWSYLFAALNSSSFMDSTKIMHWFTGNIGYHHVHHLNAMIPFYRLPEAMAAIPELHNPGRTSLAPWDIYKCFNLKLWDPSGANGGKMVSFSEAGV